MLKAKLISIIYYLIHNLAATSTEPELPLSDVADIQCFSSQARPHVNTHTAEEVLNGTHYQSIFCSASYAKPSASIHWDIHGAPPSEDIFSINNTRSKLPNGTYNTVSKLRFPIHLNNESNVACVIQHPALSEPSTTVINLQTFGRLLSEWYFTSIQYSNFFFTLSLKTIILIMSV